MAVNRKRFYLGRPGRVTALPSLTRGSNPDSPEEIIGGQYRSLSGRSMRDEFAIKKNWAFTWARLRSDDYQLIRRLIYQSTLGGAHRIVDPRNRNQLPSSVSMGGSDWYWSDEFEVTNLTAGQPTGVIDFEQDLTYPAPIGDLVDGGIRWDLGSVSGTPVLRTVDRTVVWPDSEYTFSYYAAGSSSLQPILMGFDRFGQPTTNQTGASHAVSATMTRYSASFTPAAGTVEAKFGLAKPDLTADSVITTGWQVQVDEALADWEVGVGTPEVILNLVSGYPYPGWYRAEMSVQEV